jgi:agmatinase
LRPENSIQVGMRGSLFDSGDWNDARVLGFELISTDEVREIGISETVGRIRDRMGDAKAYISFDVDFVDPAFAPGTGTPEVGGFTSREAQVLVRGLGNVDIVGCDVVEVYPAYDPAQITAFLAANVAYELLSLIAARRREEPAHGAGREPSVRH